jgi:hypothetical protein
MNASKHTHTPDTCDRATAERRLRNRWAEQVLAFPLMRQTCPQDMYVRINAQHVMENNLLKSYDKGAQ